MSCHRTSNLRSANLARKAVPVDQIALASEIIAKAKHCLVPLDIGEIE
jgi:hypothetical protein